MFSRENPQNSEPQNGPRSGLDYKMLKFPFSVFTDFVKKNRENNAIDFSKFIIDRDAKKPLRMVFTFKID